MQGKYLNPKTDGDPDEAAHGVHRARTLLTIQHSWRTLWVAANNHFQHLMQAMHGKYLNPKTTATLNQAAHGVHRAQSYQHSETYSCRVNFKQVKHVSRRRCTAST